MHLGYLEAPTSGARDVWRMHMHSGPLHMMSRPLAREMPQRTRALPRRSCPHRWTRVLPGWTGQGVAEREFQAVESQSLRVHLRPRAIPVLPEPVRCLNPFHRRRY